MALQDISGTEGNFAITGCNAKIASWAADFVQGAFNTTAFSSGGFSEAVGTIRGLVGTAAGTLQNGNPGTPATAGDPGLLFNSLNEKIGVDGTLTISGGCKIVGKFLLTRKTVGVDTSGGAIFSCAFQSTGAYTAAWAS